MIFNPTGSGKKLPSLNNPGTADDLAKGKELIGADGQIVAGTGNICKYGWNEENLPVLTSALFGTDLILGANVSMQQLQLILRAPTYLTFTDKAGTTFVVKFSMDFSGTTISYVSNGSAFMELQVTVNVKANSISAFIKGTANAVTEFIPSGEIKFIHGTFPQVNA